MEERSYAGLIVGGIFSGLFALGSSITSMVCLFLGFIFTSNPQSVDVNMNGTHLHGSEAVEMALKIGKILLCVGGIALLVAIILVILCISLITKYIRMQKQ